MTRQEARQIIAAWLVSSKGEKGQCGYIEGWFYERDVEAFDMAIKALEQEPCEDAISKGKLESDLQGIWDAYIPNNMIDFHDMLEDIYYKIQNAPSVTPKTKTGEWIAKDGIFYCSCCDNDAGLSEEDVSLYKLSLPNFCPNCGARMGRDTE